MSGGVILIMAQVDDVPGELLGHVIDKMTEMGAKNVQLLSSLVDIKAEDEPDFAALLVGDLGIWGYRVLESQHKHFDIRRYQTTLELRWGEEIRRFPLRIKRILNEGVFMRAKAEHDDLAAISQETGLSVAVLKAAIETAVGTDEPAERLDVDLGNWLSRH